MLECRNTLMKQRISLGLDFLQLRMRSMRAMQLGVLKRCERLDKCTHLEGSGIFEHAHFLLVVTCRACFLLRTEKFLSCDILRHMGDMLRVPDCALGVALHSTHPTRNLLFVEEWCSVSVC